MFNLFRLCRKDEILRYSFDIVALCGNKVKRSFDNVACCFDIVTGEDGALRENDRLRIEPATWQLQVQRSTAAQTRNRRNQTVVRQF